MNIITEMIKNGTKREQVYLINAIVDLMRLQTKTTESMKLYLSSLLDMKNTQLNEIILTILIERSFGDYVQIGALRSLTELLQKYPELVEMVKKKSPMFFEKVLSSVIDISDGSD